MPWRYCLELAWAHVGSCFFPSCLADISQPLLLHHRTAQRSGWNKEKGMRKEMATDGLKTGRRGAVSKEVSVWAEYRKEKEERGEEGQVLFLSILHRELPSRCGARPSLQDVYPALAVRSDGKQREGSAPLGFPQHHCSFLFSSWAGGQERRNTFCTAGCSGQGEHGTYPVLLDLLDSC